jgi:hypothetical protein
LVIQFKLSGKRGSKGVRLDGSAVHAKVYESCIDIALYRSRRFNSRWNS